MSTLRYYQIQPKIKALDEILDHYVGSVFDKETIIQFKKDLCAHIQGHIDNIMAQYEYEEENE